jgi:hypothetical protein
MTKYQLEYHDLNGSDGWQRWSSPPLSQSEIIHLKESAQVVAVRDGLAWDFRVVPATGENHVCT